MEPWLLDILACPRCPGHPLVIRDAARRRGTALVEGTLTCSGCGTDYPVTQGIPDLLPRESHAELDKQRQVRQFDKRAGLYDFLMYTFFVPLIWGGPSRGYLTRWLITESGLAANGFALDLACGPGTFTRALAKHAKQGHAVGLDISWRMLLRGAGNARRERLTNVGWVRGDAERLPFQSHAFTASICNNSLHQIPHRELALAGLHRALQLGARFAGVIIVRGQGD
ncbi:MAG: methyltransferase domain-containing protein, partial [Chloroflexi bacterium]|nr:methyltransferase domain-containing protein [Chloroflexota bacterium]